MPIYIAYDENSKIESVILAKNIELANVYWQGAGVLAASTKSIIENSLDNHLTGVIPIVKTEIKKIPHLRTQQDVIIRVISKS